MNKDDFVQLQRQYGENCVFQDGDEYFFSIGYDVDHELCFKLQEKYGIDEYVNGVRMWIGYGDDLCNSVSVTSLEDMPEDIEMFVRNNIGDGEY